MKKIYLFLVPTFILLALFSYYPPIMAILRSFYDWNGANKCIFIGFSNFIELFSDENFLVSILNVLKFTAFGLAISVTVPVFVAEMIHGLKNTKAQYYYRLLLVLPMVVPGMVTILLWQFIYDPNVGLLNSLLTSIGLEGLARAWLSDMDTALGAIMFMGFPWIGGITVLIYLAGLQSIDQSVYDAVAIDGAVGIRRFLSVDLPLIMGQIKLNVILTIIGGLQSFSTVLILTNGGPGTATLVPGLHMYQNAFTFGKMGYGSAIGVTIFIAILLLTIVNSTLIRSNDEHAGTKIKA